MDHLTMSLETLQKQLNEKQTSRQTTPKKTDKTQPVESKVHYHMVTAGDTLYSISKKYNVGVDELRRLNQMTADGIIVPGQKLVVPK
jgi:LysM repeat protein